MANARKKPNLRKRPAKPEKEVFMDKEKGRVCLLQIHEVLSEMGINHFLILGTALGAHRDHGFVPTEKDIDIGFLQEEFTPRCGELAEKLCHYGYDVRLVSRPFQRCRVAFATRDKVKIDLVSYIKWKDKRFCSNSDPKTKPYSIVHDREMLETYEKIEVFGQTFLVPSPIERYLELEYGLDWRTPRQDHKSRTRVYHYRTLEKIPNDLLNAPS